MTVRFLDKAILRRVAASLGGVCALLALGFTSPVNAQTATFDLGVVPSRFELSAKSGQRLGQSLEIVNQSSQATELAVRTIDWDLTEKGDLKFYDELRDGSCRPWVTLQRKTIRVAGRNKSNFRFQLDIPADAAITECRFMIAIEGVLPAYQTQVQSGGANLSLPVNGRIAVAVYVAVNGAKPVLSVQQVSMATVEGKTAPSMLVTNSGNAHGRMDGALDAKDASGQSFELVPDGGPIMPGQTRLLELKARSSNDTSAIKMVLPVTASGTLDWDEGSFKVNAEFK